MSSFGITKRETWIGVAIVAVVGWAVINCLILLAMWIYHHIAINFI